MLEIVLPSLTLLLFLVVLSAAIYTLRRGRGQFAAALADARPPERRKRNLDRPTLNVLDEAVVYLDETRRVLWANPAAKGLLGAEEGRPLIESVRDHDLDDVVRRSVDSGAQLAEIVELDRPHRALHVRVLPLGDAGTVLVASDRTEVQHLLKVRRELVANVSHELRTPLATLQLLIETLLEGADEDPEARRDFLGKLREQVVHLNGTVQQGLHLASLEGGELRLLSVPIEVGSVVGPVVTRLLPQARRAGVEIERELPAELPCIQANAEQVSRVLTNLLDNAIKWTPRSGRICVGAHREDGYVRFWVRDTGPGIPRETLPRLFERFYKGDESRTGTGTGLGLAIAKHTVLMHGGRIWAESEEGEGATFVFTIPVAERLAA